MLRRQWLYDWPAYGNANGVRMSKAKLLIVEDDEGLCSQYRWAFPEYDLLFAHNRAQALALR